MPFRLQSTDLDFTDWSAGVCSLGEEIFVTEYNSDRVLVLDLELLRILPVEKDNALFSEPKSICSLQPSTLCLVSRAGTLLMDLQGRYLAKLKCRPSSTCAVGGNPVALQRALAAADLPHLLFRLSHFQPLVNLVIEYAEPVLGVVTLHGDRVRLWGVR